MPEDNEDKFVAADERAYRERLLVHMAATKVDYSPNAPPSDVEVAKALVWALAEAQTSSFRRAGFESRTRSRITDMGTGSQLPPQTPTAMCSCGNCGSEVSPSSSYSRYCPKQRRVLRFCNDGQACLKRKQAGVKSGAPKAKKKKPEPPQGSLF
jgi:hypothetical protein